MNISSEGLEQIKRFEGFSPDAYKSPSGVWKIGYGHIGKGIRKGVKITKEKAEEWLILDCNQVLKMLRNKVTVPLRQYQLDALVSFGYSTGCDALSKSMLLKLVNRNPDSKDIPGEFKRWVYCESQLIEALRKRRETEAAMYSGTLR
ncbi:MAG: lysozyme [Bacteroidales bacterium]